MLGKTAIIEIPQGSRHKYEIDKETGRLKLDRMIRIPYPHNYGFVEGTLAQDGDALDIFVYSGGEPLVALSETKFKVLGVLYCTDGGVPDEKIIARVPGVLPDEKVLKLEIVSFLTTYKPTFVVDGLGGVKEAERLITKYSNANTLKILGKQKISRGPKSPVLK